MNGEALTVPAQILITAEQRLKLRTLRKLGIVSGVVLRRAIDDVIGNYAPLLETRRAQEIMLREQGRVSHARNN